MVDFAKFRIPSGDRILVTYKCSTCGEEDEYIGELPEHMRNHYRMGYRNKCMAVGGGSLVEVSRRTEPRNGQSNS